VLVIIGIALIAGGVWWGFKKGQRMGRERRNIVENLASAPEYTVGGQSSGGGDPGEGDLMGVGAGCGSVWHRREEGERLGE